MTTTNENTSKPYLGLRVSQTILDQLDVWAEDGEHLREVREGIPPEPPLQVTERLIQLGRKPEEWRAF